MKKTAAGFGVLALLAMCVATPVESQELELGTWTGTMQPPGGGSMAVGYEVGRADGALSIVMSGAGQTMVFHDVKLEADELTFWWEPGPRIDCTLARQEGGSFEGICSEGTGADGDGTLIMVPPSG